MLPSTPREVKAFSVLFTEPITKKGEKYFRFIFKLKNKEAHFDMGGTKEEVEVVEKRVKDFLNDVTSKTLIVEYDQEGKKLYFLKFETNEKALKFLDRRKVEYPYIA